MVFQYKDNVFHIEDVPFPKIAEDYGTPVYVYSSTQIDANYQRLKTVCENHLPENRQPLIAYACKANGSMAIMTMLARAGCGIDIVSGREMNRAISAGCDPQKIVYSGVGKSEAEIMKAIQAGILQINIESESELHKISKIARSLDKVCTVAFRLNPNLASDTHTLYATSELDTKFGIEQEKIPHLYKIASEDPYLNPIGISTHVGSKIKSVDTFKQLFKKMAELVGILRNEGHSVVSLDLGSGFSAIPASEAINLDDYVRAIKDHILPLGTDVILEPGQYLVGNAGVLLTRVMTVKENPIRKFLIVDCGMTDFIRPSMYGGEHPIHPVTRRKSEQDKDEKVTYDIGGPVCETADMIGHDRHFTGIREDDLLAVMEVGAYGIVHSSPLYNGRFIAPEVMVRGSETALIREMVDVEILGRYEKQPEWAA